VVELDFRHIEPTPMDRREVELELVESAASFNWLEELVEGDRIVRVEIVEHYSDVSASG
jgi:hypothetical protein